MTATTPVTPLTPLTKWQARKRNDVRGQARYSRRTSIDKRLEDMRLERQLQEVVT